MHHLFEPLAFRSGLTAKNRLALAPMTNKQSNEDGSVGEDERNWLYSRAKAGFGLIESCASHVALDGQAWQGELGIFDDRLLPGLTTLAAGLRERGAASFVQLFHGGLRADPGVNGIPAWSASEGQGARAATEEDIARVSSQFVEAAVRAKKAGFDGVEVHGAHGYLFGQFLSALDNQRTDRWGGALENRARLLRDVTRAIRAQVGPAFTVGVRLSPEDFGQSRGLDLDENLTVAKWLAEDGIDFLHLSLWRAQLNTRKRPTEHAIPLFRAALPDDVKILVAGNVWTRADADELLARGADGIALGRSAVVNRDWPTLARNSAWAPVRPPVTVEHLVENDLNPTFAAYMGNWKGFLVGTEGSKG